MWNDEEETTLKTKANRMPTKRMRMRRTRDMRPTRRTHMMRKRMRLSMKMKMTMKMKTTTTKPGHRNPGTRKVKGRKETAIENRSQAADVAVVAVVVAFAVEVVRMRADELFAVDVVLHCLFHVVHVCLCLI